MGNGNSKRLPLAGLYHPFEGSTIHRIVDLARMLQTRRKIMRQVVNVNPISEHGLDLRLFITNGGGL
jgi:hypothetical protein